MANGEYRPKGWKNPHGLLYKPGENSAVDVAEGEAYEAGADAMLKVLRANALLVRHGDTDSFVSGTRTINFDEGDTGHLVFIPRNGKKEKEVK